MSRYGRYSINSLPLFITCSKLYNIGWRGEKRRIIESMEGVRKGIWTPEEDILLRKCIETYGQGKWHLVPLRAGLNRCRKSCRLRWLNYLKPNIKRGQFSNDEVDLIVRLHKLLGNRWSLIAGRLPGRTANDIKNFWNSNIEKRVATEALPGRARAQKSITRSNILRPRPRTFSAPRPEPGLVTADTSQSHDADECTRWWSNLLEIATDNDYGEMGLTHDACNTQQDEGDDAKEDFTDFSIDVDIWKLLNFGEDA